MPTPGAPGSTSGWFAHGAPPNVPYTVLTSDWANAVQAELLNVIAAAGLTPDKTNQSQLLNAIKGLITGGGSSGGTVSAMVPVGSMQMWPTNTAPTGWVLCGGQALSRTTYAALFAVIGTTYGSGDGSTTFALPDLRGRVPVGRDNMAGTNASRISGVLSGTTLGATGGDQFMHAHNHPLSLNDPGHVHGVSDPTHGHTVSDPTHAHSIADPAHNHPGTWAYVGNQGYAVVVPGAGIAPIQNYRTGTEAAGTGIGIYGAYTGIGIYAAATGISVNAAGTGMSGAIGSAGAGGAQNAQPSIILNYIIFAGV